MSEFTKNPMNRNQFIKIVNRISKPLSPKILPTNEDQIGHSCFINLPRIGFNPRVILTNQIIQDIVELRLPCLGVWLISSRFSILNLDEEDLNITSQNYYVSNESSPSVVVSYADSTHKILSQGQGFTIEMSDIYIANENLTLKLKSIVVFEGSCSLVNIPAESQSTINECVLRATRIA